MRAGSYRQAMARQAVDGAERVCTATWLAAIGPAHLITAGNYTVLISMGREGFSHWASGSTDRCDDPAYSYLVQHI